MDHLLIYNALFALLVLIKVRLDSNLVVNNNVIGNNNNNVYFLYRTSDSVINK